MNKGNFVVHFVVISVIALLLCVISIQYSGDLSTIKQLTGHNLTSLQTMKANCEKSLPRDKQCQLSVVASAKE